MKGNSQTMLNNLGTKTNSGEPERQAKSFWMSEAKEAVATP